MQRTTWNDGWEFRPKTNRFLELTGQAHEWMPVMVPHDAMLTAERSADATPATGYHHSGVYEYRKVFRLPDVAPATRVLVEFEGVYRDATVSVNGEPAAHWPYGYSKFAVDVAPHARAGDNEIRVEARAGDDTRWYSGGGIYRDVWLAVGGPVHVTLDGLRVTTPDVDDARAIVAVETTVENDSAETVTVDVLTEIIAGDGKQVVRDVAPFPVPPRTAATVRQRVAVVGPQRWSVEHPHLYSCRTTLVRGEEAVDEATASFGIRTLSVDSERGLRINGEIVKLRGACIHHDNGVIGAATLARAEERRIEILKAAGFNALRSAHNPMSRAMIEACDRFGMLVMDETFDMWTRSKSDDDYARNFPEWWEADIAAMIDKDFNHPSVILYSIGNEILEIATVTGVVWSRRLVDAIRARDDTRLVTNGINALFAVSDQLVDLFAGVAPGTDDAEQVADAGVNTQMTQLFDQLAAAMRDDVVDEKTSPAFATLDVAGYNYLEARYDIDRERHPNRVIVGTETHPLTIDRNWQYVEQHGNVIGDFTWTGWDYLGEAGIGRVVWADQGTDDVQSGFMGAYPWLVAWCGDIDITGHRRPVSYYREIVFGLRNEPYVAVERPGHVGEKPTYSGPWSWSDTIASWTWPGHDGEQVRVEVYSAADEVELIVNGRKIGRAPAGPANRFRAEFLTEYEPGTIEAVAYRDGAELARSALQSATGDVLLDVRADRSEVAGDGRDLAYVTITLVDGSGTPDPSADREVAVEIGGPGVLQGFGSAAPKTDERFTDPQHATFDGRALAVVRPTAPGTIVISVTADGCSPSKVEVTAR